MRDSGHYRTLAVIVLLSFEKSNSVLMMDHAKSVSMTDFNAASRRSRLVGAPRVHAEARIVPIDGYPDESHALWRIPADLAFPCATQNELTGPDATALVDNGCIAVIEGASMPSTPEANDLFQAAKALFGPGKAANAGGVATSQLEMSQNASMQCWTLEQVDTQLKAIMAGFYARTRDTAIEFDAPDDLVLGANVAAFIRVADAMIEQGLAQASRSGWRLSFVASFAS